MLSFVTCNIYICQQKIYRFNIFTQWPIVMIIENDNSSDGVMHGLYFSMRRLLSCLDPLWQYDPWPIFQYVLLIKRIGNILIKRYSHKYSIVHLYLQGLRLVEHGLSAVIMNRLLLVTDSLLYRPGDLVTGLVFGCGGSSFSIKCRLNAYPAGWKHSFDFRII